MPYLNRLDRLQKMLRDFSCDALLVDDLISIFYLTGLDLSAGKLLVHNQGAYLIVDSRYLELCRKASPMPVLENKSSNLEELLTELLSDAKFSFIQALAFDRETTSYKDYQQLRASIDAVNAKTTIKRDLIPLDNLVKQLRAIKDTGEINALREAARLGSQGFDFVCSILREGITEGEVAAELEIFWKRRGSKTVAFEPIIAFGPNSSMPHYRGGKEKLAHNSVVLVDIGVNLSHYHSDMTRMVYFGQPDPRIATIHAIVQQAQQAALALCRPGILIGELDAAARKFITDHGYGKQFVHGLGHGVGLEIHELPVVKNTAPYKEIALDPGMVITIEPGIYLPGVGGVRIEDTVVITETGCENLTDRSSDPFLLS